MKSEYTEKVSIKHIPTKRTFDFLFATSAIVIGLPIFALITLAITISSKGKAIYSQERIGRGGKPFRCYKFRTMYRDADTRLQELLKSNSELHHEWHATRKLRNDPRITPIGKFLRKTSLDELPQFWNVLKGDLSVVGPRAVVHEEIIQFYKTTAIKVLSMRPGLTCFWQVSGRNDISYSKRVELDLHYIDNHSFLVDLVLIAKTVAHMVFPKGAY